MEAPFRWTETTAKEQNMPHDHAAGGHAHDHTAGASARMLVWALVIFERFVVGAG